MLLGQRVLDHEAGLGVEGAVQGGCCLSDMGAMTLLGVVDGSFGDERKVK